MIPHIHRNSDFAVEALAAALGRPIAEQDVLGDLIVARSALEDDLADDDRCAWMLADWWEHLDEPTVMFPWGTGGPGGLQEPIFHVAVRLHPNDRQLTPPEWSQIAHRLADATGVAPTDDAQACRWVALQAQPGRLDLIANLIRLDGRWAHHHNLHQSLAAECRRIESDLGLVPARPTLHRTYTARPPARHTELPNPSATQSPASVAAQLANLMCQLADEKTGPIASVRGLVEQAAHRLDDLPHSYGPAAGHRLELIARRLHGIQQDLEATAADLPGAKQRAPVASPPATAPHTSHRRTL
ncbi:hypothetical protein [Streptomyces chattanoogensis]|uniref:Relaxase/mobilization nuclease n=1 Tax=Streptomyces chattanoogensis TaxID=66876 RepID=A0A0N0GZD5_9ACTN|nr:hypothetical protein [Streptomyces chattanoogensis]KPC62661.1 hypothetical protein ADL29_18110 [Streptomyces chattanoogensis]